MKRLSNGTRVLVADGAHALVFRNQTLNRLFAQLRADLIEQAKVTRGVVFAQQGRIPGHQGNSLNGTSLWRPKRRLDRDKLLRRQLEVGPPTR